jgi:hypothetical protein
MIILLLLILIWKLLYSILLSIFIEYKIANNIRCFINNMLFVILYNIIPDISIIYVPLSSYIYDLYLIYMHSKTKLQFIKEPMTTHHIISIIASFYIINGHLRYEIFEIFYITFISNIFIFVSYHFIKKMPTYKLLNNIILIIQTVIYTYCRIYILTLLLYNQYNKVLLLSIYDKLFIGLIYMMGIIWSGKLWCKILSLIDCRQVTNLLDCPRVVGEWSTKTDE